MKRNSLIRIALLILLAFACSRFATAQGYVHFNKTWWESMGKDEHWDFIYGFTDCGAPVHSSLRTNQYEDYVSAHVNSEADSVLKLIRLAPQRVKAIPDTPGGEVWKERHGFNDGDLWGDQVNEGRAWVEGYMACENRSVTVAAADRYVSLMLHHYSDPKRHLDKLANVLEPLLPAKTKTQP